jgi:hypothetical protein
MNNCPSLSRGVYFNMLRNPSEKNKDSFDHRWPFLFNSVIDAKKPC